MTDQFDNEDIIADEALPEEVLPSDGFADDPFGGATISESVKPMPKKGKKAKKAKAAPAEGEEVPADDGIAKDEKGPRMVRLVSFNPDGNFVTGEEFEVNLLSVMGKPYQFDDPTVCFRWIARRIYNQEPVSDQVQLIHDVLKNVTEIARQQALMARVSEWADALDTSRIVGSTKARQLAEEIIVRTDKLTDPALQSYCDLSRSVAVALRQYATSDEWATVSWLPELVNDDKGVATTESVVLFMTAVVNEVSNRIAAAQAIGFRLGDFVSQPE